MGNRASGIETLGTRRGRARGSILAVPAAFIERYRRFLRAGSEIEYLLRLSDARLAARGLKRETLARRILAKHGVDLGPD